MKKTIATIFAIAALLTIAACQSSKETNKTENIETTQTTVENPIAMAMPRIIIYKTTADFSNLVPIAMDDSKTQIVSYPDPADVKANKRPTLLWHWQECGIYRLYLRTIYRSRNSTRF